MPESKNKAKEVEIQDLHPDEVEEMQTEIAEMIDLDASGLAEAEVLCDYTDAINDEAQNQFAFEKPGQIKPEKPLDSSENQIIPAKRTTYKLTVRPQNMASDGAFEQMCNRIS